MAEIARRAGVGMATLYRNFPGSPSVFETRDRANSMALANRGCRVDTPE
jgi:AcrR family transcriptional regulator